jgi:ZIP family zinc transporter
VAEAAFWAFVAASSLIVGALVAFAVSVGDRPLGLIMGFGSGVLISAVAYDLVEEAVSVSANGLAVGGGFIAGALVFFVGDSIIDRRVAARGLESGGIAIVLGAILDGIPESIVIGASLLAGDQVSAAVVVAVFLSNVPESLSATAELVQAGHARARVLALWVVVALASTAAAALGYAALGNASGDAIATVQAFAAGAILTMLADEMIPEAFERAGHRKLVGLVTALGFGLAAALSFRI